MNLHTEVSKLYDNEISEESMVVIHSMWPLEQMISPLIRNKEILCQNLDTDDIVLIKKIQKQKLDVVNKRIKPSEVNSVRPEIVKSWLRSYSYGVDLHEYHAPAIEKDLYAQLCLEKEFLIEAVDNIIKQFEPLLNNNFVIFLSDPKGVLLRAAVGSNDSRAIEEFKVSPGIIWSEKTVGTCSMTLCAILEIPLQIYGPEHYGRIWDQISGSSAPIFDINKKLAGVLTLGCMYYNPVNSHTLGLAVSMADAIQREFQLKLNNELLRITFDASEEAIITVNDTGIITKANITAGKIFQQKNKDLIGKSIDDILGKQSVIKDVLDGKPVNNDDINIKKLNLMLHLRSAQPVKDCNGRNFGYVLALKNIGRVEKIAELSKDEESTFTFDKIVGSSPQLVNTIDNAKKYARLNENILILGESGTGKELYAEAIHNESRPDRPLIAINCAAIPGSLIESEFFGYEGGSFTGAERQGRPGKIELAHGGTLFLDEIGDMPLELQPVLLRVLEGKKVMRIGGNNYIPVNFRLIAATNKNLLELVRNGQFREDLYYRLAVLKINIPPLRERGTDIINLAKYFIETNCINKQASLPELSNAVILKLLQYSWPGNVRELKNVIIHAVNTTDDGVIKPEDLPDDITGSKAIRNDTTERQEALYNTGVNYLSMKDMEKITIMQTLLQTGSNISAAAKILDMSRSTLYRKVKEYGLTNELLVKE